MFGPGLWACAQPFKCRATFLGAVDIVSGQKHEQDTGAELKIIYISTYEARLCLL